MKALDFSFWVLEGQWHGNIMGMPLPLAVISIFCQIAIFSSIENGRCSKITSVLKKKNTKRSNNSFFQNGRYMVYGLHFMKTGSDNQNVHISPPSNQI